MAVLSKLYKIAGVKNTAFAVVSVAVLWSLARKASANQRRRFWRFHVLNIGDTWLHARTG